MVFPVVSDAVSGFNIFRAIKLWEIFVDFPRQPVVYDRVEQEREQDEADDDGELLLRSTDLVRADHRETTRTRRVTSICKYQKDLLSITTARA